MPTDASLDARYFDDVFSGDDDPWSLGSSAYEGGKFTRTLEVLSDRRYVQAIEIGCAHGVLTERLAPHCDDLLGIDISARAIELARERCHALPQVRFAIGGFPAIAPKEDGFDLAMLSEVAYYWSANDLALAGAWLSRHVPPGGRIMLVHWIGETDYPQTGDGAVALLAAALDGRIVVEQADRTEHYRLDLWQRV